MAARHRMPSLRPAKRAARRAIAAAGYEVRRFSGPRSSPREWALTSLGVDLVADVGAHVGTYPLELRRDGYKGRIASFEPMESTFGQLAARAAEDPLWSCRRVAVSDRSGELELHVAGNEQSSSLLAMEEAHVSAAPTSAYVRSETVPALTLDEALAPEEPYERLFVKIDVQGAEMGVLAGADRSLERAVALELELSLVPLYVGGPLYREVIDHLEGRDFELFGLHPMFSDPRTGRVLQMDGLFVRRGAGDHAP